MKPMCEANCGKRTLVSGSMYCPDCHHKYSPARETLEFRPATQAPHYETEPDTQYLLLNPCDGWHIAYGNFDHEEMRFESFTDFMRTITYEIDFFIAWGKLPNPNKNLLPIFQTKDSPETAIANSQEYKDRYIKHLTDQSIDHETAKEDYYAWLETVITDKNEERYPELDADESLSYWTD